MLAPPKLHLTCRRTSDTACSVECYYSSSVARYFFRYDDTYRVSITAIARGNKRLHGACVERNTCSYCCRLLPLCRSACTHTCMEHLRSHVFTCRGLTCGQQYLAEFLNQKLDTLSAVFMHFSGVTTAESPCKYTVRDSGDTVSITDR